MKQFIEQTEKRFSELFPERDIKVLACYNIYGEELTEQSDPKKPCNQLHRVLVYYKNEAAKLKMVLIDRMGIYIECDPGNVNYENIGQTFEFKGVNFVEFKPRKGYERDQEFNKVFYSTVDKENIRKFQFACGFKKSAAPEPKQTPLSFLKKHCPDYAEIYKMLKEVAEKEYLSGQFTHEGQVLNVQSSNGRYSFPLKNLSETCPDEEIIRLFVDLFEVPGLLKGNPLINFEKIAA